MFILNEHNGCLNTENLNSVWLNMMAN